MRSWTIGSAADCDLVVNLPKVSGHHCRLTLDEDGYVLEDLESTNGTYLNGGRVSGKVRVRTSDTITLGVSVPMPWPADVGPATAPAPAMETAAYPSLVFRGASMLIGRDPSCDCVLDLPMISSRHARLTRSEKRIFVEDLGSSNGTFLNGERVVGTAPVKEGDKVSLGSHTVLLRVEQIEVVSTESPIAGLQIEPVVLPVIVQTPSASSTGKPARKSRAFGHARLTAILPAQAVILAFAIVIVAGRSGAAPALGTGHAAPGTAVASLFWLSLAAVWFGLATAILGGRPLSSGPQGRQEPQGNSQLAARLGVLLVLCLCQAAVAWTVVSSGAGLKAAWLPSFALLGLASVVGLALGLLITVVTARQSTAWVSVVTAIMAMGFFGGGQGALADVGPLGRLVSGFAPNRCAFEALLLLEDNHDVPSANGADADLASRHDLAEESFPDESERMGVSADVMALGFMLVGLLGAAVFIASASTATLRAPSAGALG